MVTETYRKTYPDDPPLRFVECHRSDRPTDAPLRRLTASFPNTPVVDILKLVASLTESSLELDQPSTIVFRTHVGIEYSETINVLTVGRSFLGRIKPGGKPGAKDVLAWFSARGVRLPAAVQAEMTETSDGATLVLQGVAFGEVSLMRDLVRLTERGVTVPPAVE